MKRKGIQCLLLFAVLFFVFIIKAWAAQLKLKKVEFPKEVKGECHVVFKVEGDLSNARDLVAEIRFTNLKGPGGKLREFESASVDPREGIVVFNIRFAKPGERMALCQLRYTMDGNTLKTNEVGSSWFNVTNITDVTSVEETPNQFKALEGTWSGDLISTISNNDKFRTASLTIYNLSGEKCKVRFQLGRYHRGMYPSDPKDVQREGTFGYHNGKPKVTFNFRYEYAFVLDKGKLRLLEITTGQTTWNGVFAKER